MSKEIVVRGAVAEDALQISRLVTELGYSASKSEIAERLSFLLEEERYLVLVAVGDGEDLTGWVTGERRLSLESGTGWEITGLVVSSTARRRGVARALVVAVENWARSQHATAVRVRSNVARPESHAFYEANGYVRQKTQHAYKKPL